MTNTLKVAKVFSPIVKIALILPTNAAFVLNFLDFLAFFHEK